MKNTLKISIFIILFLVLVFIGLDLLIADYGKDENQFTRMMAIISLAGIILGLFGALFFRKWNYFLILLFFSGFLFFASIFFPNKVNKFLAVDKSETDRPPIVVYKNQIQIYSPKLNEKIKSPLKISGRARGNWFFEATFPVVLTDWDGKIIVESYAQAKEDWMTTDFVPFEAVLNFESSVFNNALKNHFSRNGYLILRKANPSGLLQHDDALEIPVKFE